MWSTLKTSPHPMPYLQLKQANGSETLPCLTQLKWTGTYWARYARLPWPSLPTGLTCASKGCLEQESPNPWRSSYLHSLNSTLNTSIKSYSYAKKNSGTRSFADLLQWLDPPEAVLKRLGRLLGDQERKQIQLFTHEI